MTRRCRPCARPCWTPWPGPRACWRAPAPEVYVNAYGESGIEYIVRSWAKTADYWTAYYALLENIKAAFDEKSVEMPYNHLNVHIVDPLR